MSIFGKGNITEQSTLLVAVESGVVRVGISLGGISEKPTLVFEIEEKIDAPADASIDRLTSALLTALEHACDQTHEEGIPHIASRRVSRGLFDAISIMYGAPWYVSRARTVSIEHDTPLLLSKKNIPRLVETYAKDILPHDEAMTVIESAVTGFTVNGYPVANPHGKKAEHIGMTLFASAIPTRLKESVEDTIARFFAGKNPRTYSIPFIVTTTLTHTNPALSDFLFIDVSSRMTEITRSSKEGQLLTVSFPKGTLFVRDMSATSGNILPHEVDHTLATEEKSKMHMDEKSNVKESLARAGGKWAEALLEAIQKIPSPGTMPSAIFLRAPKEYRTPLSETLRAYKEMLKLRDPGEINALSGDVTKSFCAIAGGVKSDDPLLRLGAFFKEAIEV